MVSIVPIHAHNVPDKAEAGGVSHSEEPSTSGLGKALRKVTTAARPSPIDSTEGSRASGLSQCHRLVLCPPEGRSSFSLQKSQKSDSLFQSIRVKHVSCSRKWCHVQILIST